MSNVIKAYAVRYKEEKKVVDVSERVEAIHRLNAKSLPYNGEPEAAFVSGLQAVTLEDPKDAAAENEEALGEEASSAEEISPEEKEAQLQEWLEAEKERLRLEMEKEMQEQSDIILGEAVSKGEQLKAEARREAEAEKQGVLEAARKEGYEAGQLEVQQELSRMQGEFAAKEEQLAAEYEQKVRELEPLAAEVVVRLLDGLTGVLLENKKGIVTYLASKALSEADRSDTFLIKVSKEDFEEVRKSSDALRGLFEREVSLEVIQDILLKKGECLIETDSGIIDCSLGVQMEGLKEDIRLLSVQGRA